MWCHGEIINPHAQVPSIIFGSRVLACPDKVLKSFGRGMCQSTEDSPTRQLMCEASAICFLVRNRTNMGSPVVVGNRARNLCLWTCASVLAPRHYNPVAPQAVRWLPQLGSQVLGLVSLAWHFFPLCTSSGHEFQPGPFGGHHLGGESCPPTTFAIPH